MSESKAAETGKAREAPGGDVFAGVELAFIEMPELTASNEGKKEKEIAGR